MRFKAIEMEVIMIFLNKYEYYIIFVLNLK